MCYTLYDGTEKAAVWLYGVSIELSLCTMTLAL
jgi:hypothetical protein